MYINYFDLKPRLTTGFIKIPCKTEFLKLFFNSSLKNYECECCKHDKFPIIDK